MGVILLLNAVSGILIARLLGPSGKGALALAFVWGGLASQLADCGISQALAYFASRQPPSTATLWGQGFMVAAAQSAVAVPVAIIASRFLVHSSSAQLVVDVAILALPLSLTLGYQLSLLRGAERFGSYNVIRLSQAVGWAATVAVFTTLAITSPLALMIGFILILFAEVIAAGVLLWRLLGRPHFAGKGVLALFRYGVLVWVAGIGSVTNSRFDQFVLGAVVTEAALGQYAAAVSFASFLTIVSLGIATVTLPAVARAKGREALAVGRRNCRIGLALMSVGAALFALLAPELITGLLGDSFRPAVPLLRILLLGQVALGTTQILHEVARGQGRLRFPAITETAGAVATVLMLLFAVPRWGALGAAWVSVAVYWPVTLVLWEGILRRPREGVTPGEAIHETPTSDIMPAG